MRTKLANLYEVAHYWANQIQEEGQSSCLFFRGNTIYSYGHHFPIAKHCTNKRGESYVLFTLRSYSPSTGRHINMVGSACNHLEVVYCLTPEDATNHYNDVRVNDNIDFFIKEIQQQTYKLAVARKPEIYINNIHHLQNQLKRYAYYTETKLTKAESKFLQENITSKETTDLILKRQKAEKATKLRKQRKAIKDFKAFKVRTINNRANDLDYLRFNTESKRVQTSQGVEVPEVSAKIINNKLAAFWRIIDKQGKGKEIINGGINLNVPGFYYQLHTLTKNSVKFGCHQIERKEIEQIATAQNW